MPDEGAGRGPVRAFWLKNAIFLVNLGAGLFLAAFTAGFNEVLFLASMSRETVRFQARTDLAADLLLVGLASVVLFFYERPIRKYVYRRLAGEPIPAVDDMTAKRRLLNEPFFVIKLYLISSLVGALSYLLLMPSYGLSWTTIRLNLADALASMAVILAFAVVFMITIQQTLLAPFFFPEGRLSAVPGTRRMSLRARSLVLLAVVNILPFGFLIRYQIRLMYTGLDPDILFNRVSWSIYLIAGVAVLTGLVMTALVARIFARSMGDLVRVVRRVGEGDYAARVRVTTNDEIGYVGDAINEMCAGLAERERLRRSLILAREVQQNLLPQTDPRAPGLDVAGRSIYCEGTGGDYYDYLYRAGDDGERLAVAVGDVSGHGIHSALLMASVRGFLRQRAALAGGPAEMLTDVNHQVARDVEQSAHFMTMVLVEFEAATGWARWVNAGHDPPLVYDPRTDAFFELDGRGVALGVLENFCYLENRSLLEPGQVVVIATDGVWEAMNASGEMFGKTRLRAAIRAGADRGSRDLLDGIVDAVRRFLGPVAHADDVTLVVIRVLG